MTPTEMQVHVSPCDMQCVHDPMFSSHSTKAVANIEKIRSKYVLSKIIDGLEKSAIVGQNLTTNTIYISPPSDMTLPVGIIGLTLGLI